MKIAIDCRFWGLEHTGIGRYTMRLVEELSKIDKENEYFLLIRKKNREKLNQQLKNKNFHLVVTEARQYSFKEQILVPNVLHAIKPDIYHAVDINIPVFKFLASNETKLVVTIHDLTRQASIGARVTTLPLPIYWLKYLITKYWVMKQAIETASAIIVPSKFVEKQLKNQYQKSKTTIYVTYEAPKDVYFVGSMKQNNEKIIKQLLKKYNLKPKSYLVYTGNAYPHKNLERLIKAIHELPLQEKPILTIVCSRNVFRKKVEKLVEDLKMEEYVKFLGFVDDEDLRSLYRHSLAFITPSLLEGFGLSGLEAMASGSPVLSANTSCLPEIYGNVAVYFNPYDHKDIAKKIKIIMKLDDVERKKMIKNGIQHAKTFSWKKMAKETFNVYRLILS